MLVSLKLFLQFSLNIYDCIFLNKEKMAIVGEGPSVVQSPL